MEETRLRDADGTKGGPEPNSLDCLTLDVILQLVGLAPLRKSWDQLQARSSSGKRVDRGVLVECMVSLG